MGCINSKEARKDRYALKHEATTPGCSDTTKASAKDDVKDNTAPSGDTIDGPIHPNNGAFLLQESESTPNTSTSEPLSSSKVAAMDTLPINLDLDPEDQTFIPNGSLIPTRPLNTITPNASSELDPIPNSKDPIPTATGLHNRVDSHRTKHVGNGVSSAGKSPSQAKKNPYGSLGSDSKIKSTVYAGKGRVSGGKKGNSGNLHGERGSGPLGKPASKRKVSNSMGYTGGTAVAFGSGTSRATTLCCPQGGKTFGYVASNAGNPGKVSRESVKGGQRRTHTEDEVAKASPDIQQEAESYQFADLKGATVMKLPRSISGQGFEVKDCAHSDIYIMDHCAQVMIDDCSNCCIFVGPTEGSVFIRDCKNCKFIVACSQFRTVNVEDSDIMLHCGTKPVIESSKNLGFCAWNCTYQGHHHQLEASKLSIFRNFWSDIFDFTPSPQSWHFIPKNSCTLSSMQHPVPSAVQALISGTSDHIGDQHDVPVTVPLTHGTRPEAPFNCDSPSMMCVLVPSAVSAKVHGSSLDTVASELLDKILPGCVITRTNKVLLSQEDARRIVALVPNWHKRVAKALADEPCITCEVTGSPSAIPNAAALGAQLGAFCTSAPEVSDFVRFHGISG